MISYSLIIKLKKVSVISVGKLGIYKFPKGQYIYTGSAKKNLEARINRHLLQYKNLHWHIDYLLANESTNIINVERSKLHECDLNKSIKGAIIVPGFGSSDCLKKCGSHLKCIEVFTKI